MTEMVIKISCREEQTRLQQFPGKAMFLEFLLGFDHPLPFFSRNTSPLEKENSQGIDTNTSPVDFTDILSRFNEDFRTS